VSPSLQTAQQGQAVVGAVAVSWSPTDGFSMVTLVKCTAQAGGSNAVMHV
jgi:hypothetical protein